MFRILSAIKNRHIDSLKHQQHSWVIPQSIIEVLYRMTRQLQPYQLTSCLVEFGSVWWASTVAVRISTMCNSQCRYCCSQRVSWSRCRGWCTWHVHSWPTCNHGQGQETLWARQCGEIPVFHIQKVRGMSWKNHLNVQNSMTILRPNRTWIHRRGQMMPFTAT